MAWWIESLGGVGGGLAIHCYGKAFSEIKFTHYMTIALCSWLGGGLEMVL